MKARTWHAAAAALILLLVLIVSGGCNDGGDGKARMSAYLDGELRGEMAPSFRNHLDLGKYDCKSTDKMLIIGRAADEPIDDATMAGAAAVLAAGQPVALEHASEAQVNSFLGKLGMEQNFKLEKPGAAVEIFAIEKRDGNNFFYVAMSDESGELVSPYIEERSFAVSGDKYDEKGELLVRTKTVSDDMPDISDGAAQEKRVKDFLLWAATGKERLASLKHGLRGGEAELQELAEANVWDKNLSSDGQTFTIRYTIYTCHSFTQNLDYYLISQSGQLNPSALWKRTEEGRLDYPDIYEPKVEGQMRRYLFKNYWGADPDTPAPLVKSSPESANGQSTLTSGMSWSASGTFGFTAAGPTGNLSSGVNFSSSQSFSMSDCTVNDRCGSEKGHMASWEYTFADPANGDKHFYWTDLRDAPLLARSNFQPINQWIWTVPRDFSEKYDSLNFKSEFTWTNGRSNGAINCFYIEVEGARHRDWMWHYYGFWVPLSKPPLIAVSLGQMDFTKAGESKSLTMVSAKDWTASSDQPWCDVQEKSGGATDAQGMVLHITAAPNGDGANREAVVTLTSTDGRESAKFKVFQSQY